MLIPSVSSHEGGWRKPAKFLGIEDKKKGSNPWSPGRVPSKAGALGRKGTEAERWVLSTIVSHNRSGMAAMELVDLDVVAGEKAAAEPAIARAAAMVFMVNKSSGKVRTMRRRQAASSETPFLVEDVSFA